MHHWIFIGIFAFAFTAKADIPAKLDFHQALQTALEHSPDYDIALAGEDTAILNRKNSYWGFFPQFNLEAQHYYSRQGPGDFGVSSVTSTGTLETTPAQTPWSNNLGLSITENLYDNGDSYRVLLENEDLEQAAKLSKQKARQQLMLSVSKAYYSYSSAVGSLDLQKQEIEVLRREFRMIEGRFRQGMKSNRDYLRIKAQLQRSEIDFSSQKITTDTTLQTLRQTVGVPGGTEFMPIVQESLQLDNLNLPKVTAEQTFDFRIAALQNDVSDLKYRTTQRADWPRLSLNGYYNYNIPQYMGPQIAGQNQYWNAQVALVLDYALWDWGIRSRNVSVAANTRRVENDQQESTRLQVRQDLLRLSSEGEIEHTSYLESKQILKDEQAVYESLSAGYREGKVTYLEMITGLQDLFSARQQFLTLQFNLLTTRDSLAYYQGNLDEILQVH